MSAATSVAHLLSPESLSASGRGTEKLSLPALQSKMKCDPEGYEAELLLLYRHFDSSLHLFHRHSAMGSPADPVVAKGLGDMSMFLAHVAPSYPDRLADFPGKLADLLLRDGRSLPPSLRTHLAQALILLVNRKVVGVEETLRLFTELQTLGDRNLRKLAFSHVVHSIRRMNQKHKDETKNRKLQTILFSMLQEEDESKAKRSLVVLCDLHRRKVWFDDRTANAICTACFHTSLKIMITVLSFLLGYDRVEEEDDSDGSSSEDDMSTQRPHVVLKREDIYKAHHKGTAASKKKKKAKIQRVIRSMKRQQRRSSENSSSSLYTPLIHLKDAQGFAEKLFSRLQKCSERFEVKMMMLKVIARTIGLHQLVLLNFYPYLQKYVQPHQRDVTNLLAAGVQACHDMVPPDAVEPLFKQIVNAFVHDRSRPEAIAVGLNVVREICLRIPLLMTEDLLQDLVLYKKSHEKAVSTAARSLITLFREVCPSLLVKKDRGRPTNPKARPKAFGEVSVLSNVPGVELLGNGDDSLPSSDNDEAHAPDPDVESFDTVSEESSEEKMEADYSVKDELEDELVKEENYEEKLEDVSYDEDDRDGSDDDSEDDDDEEEDGDEDDHTIDSDDSISTSNDHNVEDDHDGGGENKGGGEEEKTKGKKRKVPDYIEQLSVADESLRALKRLAGSKMACISSDATDGILSNEDFQRIKELKAKKEARLALSQQGLLKNSLDSRPPTLKLPTSEQLTMKRVDPAKLEINVKRRLSKEEKLALVKAGREERGKYQSRTAVKQKKTGGLTNRQKEHKKVMPFAAKKAKVARSRQERKKQRRSGKQFRGKKAWK
uniref:Protein SDA1 n=1 Tax=Anthurium amnicola TaxID=1678845 RepID=A0A1D1XRJ6_9ARAE